jgi:general stress protein 26
MASGRGTLTVSLRGMELPQVSRPFMPGYGIAAADEGSGLLPWSWAAQRLTSAQNYWVASIRPDSGAPHAMPVWGMWDDSELWFTSGAQSRKARNLMADPRCVVTTEDAINPVIIEGAARVVSDPVSLRRVVDLMNEKYSTDIEVGFLDPAVNATFSVRPERVFGMVHGDFTGSPTRWTFTD